MKAEGNRTRCQTFGHVTDGLVSSFIPDYHFSRPVLSFGDETFE